MRLVLKVIYVNWMHESYIDSVRWRVLSYLIFIWLRLINFLLPFLMTSNVFYLSTCICHY